MNPPRRSARPLIVGFALAMLVVAALASPPLEGVWESSRAEAVATGPPPPTSVTQPPTSVTQPPTSVTQPPTSPPTQPPTVPPTSAAPPVTRPRSTSTAPRSSTTRSADDEAPAQASTTTTTLPQLLVPAENRPDAGEDGNSSSTVSEGGGLAADTKVWLSVALLLVLGIGIAALTVVYFFHTRPGDEDEAEAELDHDEADGVPAEMHPDRTLVGAGVGSGFATTRRAGDILAGEPPTAQVPVVPSEAAEPPDEPAARDDPPEPESTGAEASDEPGRPDAGPDDPLAVLTRLLNDPPPGSDAP